MSKAETEHYVFLHGLGQSPESWDRVISSIGTQYKMPKMMLPIQNLIFRLMPEKSFAKMNMKNPDILMLTKSMLNLDFSVKLKDISCPSLILCGEKDNANKKASMYI